MIENIAAGLDTNSKIEGEKDTLGGFQIYPSDIYLAKIDWAHYVVSPKGAKGIAIQCKMPDDSSYRKTIYMTSGNDKGCKNTYTRNGSEHYLPGFLLMNSLANLVTGKDIGVLLTEAEEGVINLYNKEAGAEVPTKVPLLKDLSGQMINIGIIEQEVNKQVKGADNKYTDTAETRKENDIDKFFDGETGMTNTEKSGGSEEASFINTWKNNWRGKVKNRVRKVAANAPSSAPAGGSGPAAATECVFDD